MFPLLFTSSLLHQFSSNLPTLPSHLCWFTLTQGIMGGWIGELCVLVGRESHGYWVQFQKGKWEVKDGSEENSRVPKASLVLSHGSDRSSLENLESTHRPDPATPRSQWKRRTRVPTWQLASRTWTLQLCPGWLVRWFRPTQPATNTVFHACSNTDIAGKNGSSQFTAVLKCPRLS